MSEKLSLDGIRKYWTEQAGRHGASPAASWSDVRVIELEIKDIVARLEDGELVQGIGCASAFSTVEFAAGRLVRMKGVDSAPEPAALARRQRRRMGRQVCVVRSAGEPG